MLENQENESINNYKIKEDENKDKNISTNNNKETIILILIDKIISNVIHESTKNEIYTKLNLFCYNYAKNQINDMLKTKFFFHDNETNENKGKIFWNYNPEKFDNWTIFKEPKNAEKDRNNSNMINIMTCKNTEPNKFVKNNNALTELIELENNISPNKMFIKKGTLKIKRTNTIKYNNLLNSNKKERQKYKKEIIELNYVDLEKEKYYNIYSEMNKNEEYNILRKEKEESKIKNEKERIINEEKKMFLEKTLKALEANKNKRLPNIDGKGLTFDPNGKIIKKSLIKVNKLKKEFMPVKSKLTENETNIQKKDEIVHKKLNINQMKNKKGNALKSKNKKILIEYNPKDKLNQDDYSKYKEKEDMDIKPITPSGSNLDRITPVTGVILKYNIFKRDGGFNYFKKYHKPSMNDFNKLSLSYSPSQMQEILLFSNNINSSNNILTNEKISYNGYKENFDDNNPLIKNAHMLSQQKNRKSMSVKILKNVNNINTNTNTKNVLLSDDLKIKQLNIDDNNSIKLSNSNNNLFNFFSEGNNNGFGEYINNSLKIKEDINNTSGKIVNENILNKKIISYKLPIIKKNKEDDKMAKFNLDIMKDIKKHNWGNYFINNYNNNELSINKLRRPMIFSPKRINFHKIETIRERKNIDKINNSEIINYQKLLVSKNKA